jgi:hypothetical protein
MFTLGALGGASVKFFKRVASVQTELADYYQFALLSGPHTFGVECIGATILANVDGAAIGAVTDGSVASGDYVTLLGPAADIICLDDFTVYDPQFSQMYVVPSAVPPATVGLTLTLLGVGTRWTPGTPGEPLFTSSNAGITAQTIETVDRAVLTYNSPTYAGFVTITDPNYGRTCQLAITTGITLPPGTILDPFGIIKWLELHLLPLTVIEYILGAQEDNDYIKLIKSELGITADTFPTDGNVKALVAAVTTVLRELQVDGDDPVTLRSVLTDTLAAVYVISGSNAHTLEEVLLAIAGIEPGGGSEEVLAAIAAVSDLLTTTLAAVYTISETNAHTLAEVLLAIAGVMDAINALSFPDLEQLTADIASILSKVDTMDGDGSTTLPAIRAAITELWEGDDKSLHDIYERVDAAAQSASAAVIAIGLVAAAVALLPGAVEALLAAQTVVLTGEMAAQTGAITEVINLEWSSLQSGITTVKGAVEDVGGQVTALAVVVDDLAAAVARLVAADHDYHGPASVTLGTPVAISGDMRLDGPIDGAFYDLATVAPRLGRWVSGACIDYFNLGWGAFVTVDGYYDDRQPVCYNHGLLLPKSICSPGGLVIHWAPGTTGTVTPWVRSVT